MRKMPEGTGSGSRLRAYSEVPDIEHSAEDAQVILLETVRLRTVISYSLWLSVFLLSGLFTLFDDSSLSIASFFLQTAAVVSFGSLLARNLSRRLPVCSIVVFGSLLALPTSQAILFAGERSVALDLSMMLLLIVPAMLKIWTWRMQLIAGVLSLLDVSVHALPSRVFLSLQSIGLTALAGILTTLMLFVKSDELSGYTSRWYVAARSILKDSAEMRISRSLWNIMMLQSSLLGVLIFLDFSLFHEDFSLAVITKIYGLIAIILSSLLVSIHPPKRLSRTILITTLMVSLVLSAARLAHAEHSAFYLSLPLVYLMLTTVILPWSIENQLQLNWCILSTDIILKIFLGLHQPDSNTISELLADTLKTYRGEISTLVFGSILSLLVAFSLQRYRLRHLAKYVDVQDVVGDPSEQDICQISQLAPNIQPERNRQLLFWSLCFGVVSSVFSTQILLLRSPSSATLILLTWVGFLFIWGVLYFQDRKNPQWPHLWGIGAILTLGLFLWPTMLLVASPQLGYYWLFWPVGLILSIGMVPWNLRELFPLILIISGFGAEMGIHLELGLVGNIVFLTSGLLSILLCVQSSRKIKEEYLFEHMHESISKCETAVEVVRAIANFLINLFDAQGAFFSASVNHLEFLREGSSYRMAAESWPLSQLKESTRRTGQPNFLHRIFPVNWLPVNYRFFDTRFGLVSPACGALVELAPLKSLTSSTKSEILGGSASPSIFVVTTYPVLELVRRQEFSIAVLLCNLGAMQISGLAEREERENLARAIEHQATQREYELSTLVHDINNTVQDLTLLCEMILEDCEEENNTPRSGDQSMAGIRETTTERVKRIASIARSVATVVSDAKRRRELEKIEDLTPREFVEVREVIQELVSYSAIRAERKRIQICEPELPLHPVHVLISVREHLETILRNLLNNAILYSDPGSIVSVSVRTDKFRVYIDVRDTGVGLTSEECLNVFQPGYRGHAAMGTQSGLGVGLSESLRVAQAAGGNITATSAGLGMGSTFTLELPIQQKPAFLQVSQPWALLVDDQPALTDFYARIARALQYSPEIANSVDEAWSIVGAKGRPGLVMTDIHLGSSDGLDLVQRLREEFGNQLPIVVISGLTSEDIQRRVREVGATDFVAKPVSRRALFARIQSLISA